MRKEAQHDADGEEIILDADTGDERELEGEQGASAPALQAKLKALRAELAEAKREATENLTGWQRAKADLVNFKRVTEEEALRSRNRTKGRIVASLVPILDSFTQAMSQEQWQDVDEAWRSGVERIHAQLRDTLAREGLEAYGAAGEPFDPKLHECVSVTRTTTQGDDDRIATVVQQGFRIGEEIVRPAKVVVYQLG